MSSSSEPPRSLRDGRYAVVGRLAEGSQGTTLDAVDKSAGRPVAIKRFQVRGARSWKEIELAEREARVLGALSHPLLPAYVEHFEEDGALYLVMEKVEGETLGALMRRQGPQPRRRVVRFLWDAARVLEYLHGLAPPVVHRDIKPNNVIRRPDGSFALVDFGSVRDRLKPQGGSTVVGTFGYMAPEQFQGRALPASDVYSVGATALALLTGVEPEALPHRGLAIDVAAALGPTADPRLVAVLQSMVEPDPDRRPAAIRPLLWSLPLEEPARRAVRDRSESTWVREGTATESRGTELPPLVSLVVRLVLTVLRVLLALGFGMLVPLALTILSLVFGKSMAEAAKATRHAADRGGDALRRMQARTRGEPERRQPTHQRAEPPRRVDVRPREIRPAEAPGPRVSVSKTEPADELEAALEELERIEAEEERLMRR